LTLARSGAAEPPIRGTLIGAVVRELVATAHPVNPKTTKRMIVRMTTMVEHYPSLIAAG
jgi:hypothetical protein